MTKRLNDGDMNVISGGGDNDQVSPKLGGATPTTDDWKTRTPGGPGPGPEAEGNTGGGSDNLFKK